MNHQMPAGSDFISDLTLGYEGALQQTLAGLLARVIADLEVDAADVLIFDQATHALIYPGGGRGFRTRTFETLTSRFGHRLLGEVVQSREIRMLRNLAKEKEQGAVSAAFANEGFMVYVGVPLVWNEQLNGVLELFTRRNLTPSPEWLESLQDLAAKGALALNNVLWTGRLQQSQLQLGQAIDAMVEACARALEFRDYEPKGHTHRVVAMTVEFARIVGVPPAQLAHIRRGAWLHDVGKMGIPDDILTKPDSLTEADWEIMRRHPGIAYDLLEPIEFLRPALEIPYCHHEKWDGTGYPRGLKGEEIPLSARLFALVDVWNSLSSDRPYRKAWPDEKVRQYIGERAGKQFDPKLAELFLKLLDSNLWRKPKRRGDAEHGKYLETVIHI